MNLRILSLFFVLLAAGYGQINVSVVYVQTGDQVGDARSEAALQYTVAVLNASARGTGITYHFAHFPTVVTALAWAADIRDGKVFGLDRTYLTGHGVWDYSAGRWAGNLRDSTREATPYGDIHPYVDLFFACGYESNDKDGIDNDEFGRRAAKKSGHRWLGEQAPGGGGSGGGSGAPPSFLGSGPGTWMTITYLGQYTVFLPDRVDVYATEITIWVWTPDPGPGDQSMAVAPLRGRNPVLDGNRWLGEPGGRLISRCNSSTGGRTSLFGTG
ncbi:MAG: hypothetical protein Q8J74_13360 [Candidatus Didemnitutus sp.]|nr:hypothetical protein [Candidatus Didemnitutus sp.]